MNSHFQSCATAWLDARVDWLVRIEPVGTAPQMETEPADDGRRHAPDQNLDWPVICKVRHIARVAVRAAIAPGEQRGHDEDRNDHDHHDEDRVEQELALGERNVTFGIEIGASQYPAA